MAPTMDETYGSMLIGVLFATFFQGVLTVQTYIYYGKYPRDPLNIRAMVALLWILDATHLILISESVYYYLVTNWGNGDALLSSTPALNIHLIFICLATLICQGFFLYRIWVFSGHSTILVVALAIPCVVTAVLEIATTILLIQHPAVSSFSRYVDIGVAMFAIAPAIDVIIAVIMCWYLYKEKTGFEKTNSLLARIFYRVVASGLVTSMLAIGSLVMYIVKPGTFIFIAIHFSLARMYTNALLMSLNARKAHKKGGDSNEIVISTTVISTVDKVSTGRFRANAQDASDDVSDVEWAVSRVNDRKESGEDFA